MLRLVFESSDPAVLDEGDNICASPWGRGLVIAENGHGEDIYAITAPWEEGCL